MKELFFIISVSILAKTALGLDYITEKPSFLTACSIRDPDFVPCSTNTMQQLFIQMREGIPDLKALQKSDPYHVRKIKLLQNNDQASLNAEMSNVTIRGLAGVVVKENKVDEKDYTISTKLFIPKLRCDGNYKLNGRLLAIALTGHGKGFIELEKVDMNMYTKVHLYEKGGFTFSNITSVKIDFKLSGLKIRLENLFNGAVELEESINTLLNENWMDFVEAMRPTLSLTVEKILLNNLRIIFNFIPAKYFISDIPTSEQLYG